MFQLNLELEIGNDQEMYNAQTMVLKYKYG